MKFINIFIFLILFLGFNTTFASNWIPIEASDGKVAEVDFDSINKYQNTLKYDIKLTTAYNYYTVTKFAINTDNNTYAQISTASYENGKKKAYTEAKNLEYKQIKQGSLQGEIYNTVNLLIGTSEDFSNKKIIEQYAKEQQQKISKNWHPNNYDMSYATNQNVSVNLESYATLILDKKGNIISSSSKTYSPDIFTSQLESDVNDIIHNKIGKFDELPNDYNGDKLILFVKFVYSSSKNAKSSISVRDNCNVAYITIAKNYSGTYQTAKETAKGIGGALITLPFAILNEAIKGL